MDPLCKEDNEESEFSHCVPLGRRVLPHEGVTRAEHIPGVAGLLASVQVGGTDVEHLHIGLLHQLREVFGEADNAMAYVLGFDSSSR